MIEEFLLDFFYNWLADQFEVVLFSEVFYNDLGELFVCLFAATFHLLNPLVDACTDNYQESAKKDIV